MFFQACKITLIFSNNLKKMKELAKLLLCAASEGEIKHLEGLSTKPQIGIVSRINNEADLLITGVGIFQTIFHLTRCLQYGRYGMVIAAGIAGEYHVERPLVSMYAVQQSVFTGFGTETDNGEYESLVGSRFLDGNMPPFCNGHIVHTASSKLAKALDIPTAKVNTVCSTNTERTYVNKLLKKFPADIETMESSAYGYVCAMMGIQLAEIRCTSNFVLPKSESKWLIAESTQALGNLLTQITAYNCKILREIEL